MWLNTKLTRISLDAPAIVFLTIWGWLTKEMILEARPLFRRRSIVLQTEQSWGVASAATAMLRPQSATTR
jgi:hypothetical protein